MRLNIFLLLFIFLLSKKHYVMQRSIFLGTQKHKISQGKRGSSSAPSVHPCTLASHLATHLPPKGLHKSVPQMTLLMPLAEIPLFYPWTCGGKAKREGERKYRQSRERCRGKKKSFLYLTRKTPLLLCIGRGEKHMGIEVAWPGA